MPSSTSLNVLDSEDVTLKASFSPLLLTINLVLRVLSYLAPERTLEASEFDYASINIEMRFSPWIQFQTILLSVYISSFYLCRLSVVLIFSLFLFASHKGNI